MIPRILVVTISILCVLLFALQGLAQSPTYSAFTVTGLGANLNQNWVDGTSARAAGVFPVAVAVDTAGSVYGSSYFHGVFRVSPNGVIQLYAGNRTTGGYGGDGGPASSAQLYDPHGLAVDNLGNLFIADSSNHRIRKVSPSGIIATFAGWLNTPLGGLNGDGPANTVLLNNPFGAGIDTSGNLYIADTYNHRIRKVTPDGRLTTVAGSGPEGSGAGTYGGDGGFAVAARLKEPWGVAVDRSGNLYIADTYNSRIRKVTSDGVIQTIAGDGSFGFGGDGGPATQAAVNAPRGLAVDASGNVYIADTNNNRIRKIALDGLITTIAGGGTLFGTSEGGPATAIAMDGPNGIAVDRYGIVYVAYFGQLTMLIPSTFLQPLNPITILSDALPEGRVQKPYSAYLGTRGGSPFSVTWSIESGALPEGLSLDPALGLILGTPKQSGTFRLVVQARDTSQQSPVRELELVIQPPPAPGTTLRITTPDSLPAARAGEPFSVALSAEGTDPPFYWSISSGSLPAGLQLETWTGVIHGVASQAGNYEFIVRAHFNAEIETDKRFRLSVVPVTQASAVLLALPAPLAGAEGLAVDSLGNLFIADTGNSRILKMTPAGRFSTVAGTGTAGYSGDNGAAVSAMLNHPEGVAVDGIGNLYIADTINSRIRKIDTSGVITTVAGTGSTGFSGDGGLATVAQLTQPRDVEVDAAGNLYIPDTGNSRVRKVTLDGRIQTIAGTGEQGYSGDEGPAIAAQVMFPWDVAVDGQGNVYIAETEYNHVRKVTPDGIIHNVAGIGANKIPFGGFSGDGGPATQAQLSAPQGIAVDRFGNLYIADFLNRQIRKVSADGTISSPTLNAFASCGGNPCSLGATSVVVDLHGNLFIGGGGLWFFPTSVIPTTALTIPPALALPVGQGDKAYSTFLAAQGGVPFSYSWKVVSGTLPPGLTLDTATGEIRGTAGIPGTFTFTVEVNDFSGMRTVRTLSLTISSSIFTTPLVIAPLAGSGPAAESLDALPLSAQRTSHNVLFPLCSGVVPGGYRGEGLASFSRLDCPNGVAVDSRGNLFVADSLNHRIRKVAPEGVITTVAGQGIQGFSGDGGPAVDASLDSPGGVATDGAGNLYIADTGNHRIRKVSPDGMIRTVAGSVRGFSGDGGAALAALLNFPYDVAVDAQGQLWIADSYNHRIRRISANGIINTVAGSGSVTLPRFHLPEFGGSYGGDGGPATEAFMNYPRGLDVDASGNLYIADTENNRVRQVTPEGIIRTVVGSGVTTGWASSFAGDGGPSTRAILSRPLGVALDRDGNLYVTDTGNLRVRIVTRDGVINTFAGNGVFGFGGDSGPATAANLASPAHVAVSSNGTVYFADSLNHRVRQVYRGSPPISSPTPWILPSTARARGLNNSFFTTDVVVANTGSATAQVELSFLGNNQDGRSGPKQSFSLQAGQSANFSDVLGTIFGIGEGYGAIQVKSASGALAINAQTWTAGSGGGTYGQSVPGTRMKDWVVHGLPSSIPGIVENDSFRTNLILSNAIESDVVVQLDLISASGSILGTKTVNLPPLGMIQLTQVVRVIGVSQPVSGALIRLAVLTPGGYLAGYAVVIDNRTNDPRTLLPQPEDKANPALWLLPSSAHAGGLGGAFYTTDLAITNTATQESPVTLKFLGNNRNGRTGVEKSVAVAAGSTVTLVDLLNQTFGLDSGFGAVRITASSEASLSVQSQTSTQAAGGGSFGQSVPALRTENLIDAEKSGSIPGIQENARYRTNLILANVTEAQVDVDVTLVAASGALLGAKRVTLLPLGMTQLNRVARELGVNGDLALGRLVLSTPTYRGAFAAYATLIDNVTNDPRTLLPQ